MRTIEKAITKCTRMYTIVMLHNTSNKYPTCTEGMKRRKKLPLAIGRKNYEFKT